MKKSEMVAMIKKSMSNVEWKVLGSYIESLKVKDLEEILQNAKKEPIKTSKKSKAEVKDEFEKYTPKKDENGYWIYGSYKCLRAAYAYNKQNVKVWRGEPQWKDGQRSKFDWSKFNDDKVLFEEHFGKYIPKAQQKK